MIPAAAVAATAAIAVPALGGLTGGGPHAAAPSLTSLARQVGALKKQNTTLARRLAALERRGTVAGAQGATGAAGATGAQGPAGAQGAQGEPGARGVSAWEVIPSGQTVTGHAALDLHASDTTGDFGFTVALPARAPAPLAPASVVLRSEDPTCTGSYTAPTAPPGKVCVYIPFVHNVSNVDAFGIDTADAFGLSWKAPATGDTYVQFAWAYTAP